MGVACVNNRGCAAMLKSRTVSAILALALDTLIHAERPLVIWLMTDSRGALAGTDSGRTFTSDLVDERIRSSSARVSKGNVLFNDALNTFYLRLYGVTHMVKDHSDSERENLLPPHGLHFPNSTKGSFICTIPETG